MATKKVFDIIGIGIGPFNLGLSALSSEIKNMECIFFDQNAVFNWHPGLLLENARLQVPFLADLVTLANPRNKFSYLNFIHAKKRMIRFGIHENYFITRKEYNEYCKWAIGQLDNLQFGFRCETIHFDQEKKVYRVFVKEIATDRIKCFYSKHIVIGVGTVPNIPECASTIKHENLFHSSDYLFHKEQILKKKSITIIGSGQSAAEIFYDLLQHADEFDSLNWFTRSDRFYAMEYSKLTLEMTSPDYVDYFYSLDAQIKKQVLAKQNNLYKGINFSLINEIYDCLDDLDNLNIGIFTSHDLKRINEIENDVLQLEFFHVEVNKIVLHDSDAVILATGYKHIVPDFLQSVKELIRWNENKTYDVNRNYSIDKSDTIFVQNADLHSHGFTSADLAILPSRNAIILNSVLKKDFFALEKNIAFQTFGVPGK